MTSQHNSKDKSDNTKNKKQKKTKKDKDQDSKTETTKNQDATSKSRRTDEPDESESDTEPSPDTNTGNAGSKRSGKESVSESRTAARGNPKPNNADKGADNIPTSPPESSESESESEEPSKSNTTKDKTVTGNTPIAQAASKEKTKADSADNLANKDIKTDIEPDPNSKNRERLNAYESPVVTKALYAKGIKTVVKHWDWILKVFAKWNYINQPLQIITYKPSAPVLEDATGLSLFSNKQALIGKSLEIFKINTPLVVKDYNQELAKILNVHVYNGTLFSSTQNLIPMTTDSTSLTNLNVFSNVEGEIKMLMYMLANDAVKIHPDRKDLGFEQITADSEPSSQIIPPEQKAEYPYFGESNGAIVPIGPALPLAARALNIPLLTEYANDLGDMAPEQGPKLELGAAARIYDNVYHTKIGHTENMLMDKFTAELLNINATAMLSDRVEPYQIQQQIESCAWPGSVIELRQDMSLVPYFIIPRRVQLASLVIAACRSREMHNLLLKEGMDYIQQCGILSLVEQPMFIVPSIATKSMAAQLRSDLTRMFGMSRINEIYGLLAAEIMPILQIPRFVPLYMQSRFPSSIVALYLYMLMQLFLPNQFWMHCRMIANELHEFFLQHDPNTFQLLITQLGVAQDVVNDVLVATPGYGDRFAVGSAFSEQVPTIFTERINEIQGANTLLIPVMQQFQAIDGSFLDDVGATQAEHPRLQTRPQHFIGIPDRGGFNLMRARIRAAADVCKNILNARWGNGVSKQERGPVSEQVDYICDRATRVMEAMCATLHIPLRTMANFPVSFMPNITPPLHHHINRNWTIQSQDGGYGYIEGMRRIVDDTQFDAADFIALLFNTNWNFHDQRGEGFESIAKTNSGGAKLPSTICMPSPIEILQRQNLIIQATRNGTLPDGLLSYIMYSQNVPRQVINLRESWALPDSSRIYTQLRRAIGDLSSISPTWLKGFSKLTLNIGRDGRLNQPHLRRRNQVNAFLPFNPAIDHHDMEHEVDFLLPIEHERLALGISMIQNVKYVLRGIRMVYKQQLSFTHRPVLLPPNLREVVYEMGVTFRTGREDYVNVQEFIMEDGTYSPLIADWGNVHLIINAPVVNTTDVAFIQEGLNRAGWYVTLSYLRYVPTISPKIVEGPSVYDLLTREAYDLTVIPFYFNTLRLEHSRFRRPDAPQYQLIYPLEDVIDKHVVSGLAVDATNANELHLALPGYTEYDTGRVGVDGHIRHSDGNLKRNVRGISMANPVIGVHKPLAVQDMLMDIVVRSPQMVIE